MNAIVEFVLLFLIGLWARGEEPHPSPAPAPAPPEPGPSPTPQPTIQPAVLPVPAPSPTPRPAPAPAHRPAPAPHVVPVVAPIVAPKTKALVPVAWPAAVPKDLPPFPAGWEPDVPVKSDVAQRAAALIPTLWKTGKPGAKAVEKTGDHWVTYLGFIPKKGKKGVAAYRVRPGATAVTV